jgi:hypothetical protein
MGMAAVIYCIATDYCQQSLRLIQYASIELTFTRDFITYQLKFC